jgi:hypothetical protein
MDYTDTGRIKFCIETGRRRDCVAQLVEAASAEREDMGPAGSASLRFVYLYDEVEKWVTSVTWLIVNELLRHKMGH